MQETKKAEAETPELLWKNRIENVSAKIVQTNQSLVQTTQSENLWEKRAAFGHS